MSDATMRPMSVDKAIWVGTLVVNGPVLLLLGAPILVLAVAPRFQWILFAYPVFFGAAWLWWSLAVPRWRLWAYARVESAQALKREAVQANLTWPSGSVFERTEIKTARQRALEKRYERRKP